VRRTTASGYCMPESENKTLGEDGLFKLEPKRPAV
jgi:hypothetical protein